MRKTFRRRHLSRTAIVLLILLLVLAARTWREFSNQHGKPSPAESLAEGTYKVVRVVDGDTLIIRCPVKANDPDAPDLAQPNARQVQARIRLIGIDAPETVKPNHPVEPWGPQAAQFSKRFVAGGEVTLRMDRRRIDRHLRFLAYVYVDERMLNEELVRAGLASVSHYQGDSSEMARRFRRAEQEAKDARVGIWSGNL